MRRRVWALLAALMVLCRPYGAQANPEGGVVAAGQASITSTATSVDIQQQSAKTVIDWRGFDIAPHERTEFHQPSSSAIALNRVNSPNASTINGTLKANGNVIIINQNGVLFGKQAAVDVNGLVATTADADNAQFINESTTKFDKPGNPNAAVVNEGTITARDSGLVGFVAPRVENHGVITARLGTAHLAAGDTATVDFYGDGLMEVAVSDDVTRQLVKNTGSIVADGGTIALTAAAGSRVLASTIEVQGTLQAQTAGLEGGKIIIAAAGKHAVPYNLAANRDPNRTASRVTVGGALNASGKNAGEKGGAISVTGDEVALVGTARLDASGSAGGGSIKVGGDYLGQGTTPVALSTYIGNDTVLDASATALGHGGNIIVFAAHDTLFNGRIFASGAGLHGNGGFVETSGKDTLGIGGTVRAAASQGGQAGSWLLDPADITITAGTNSNITAATPFTPTGTGSQLSAATIGAALDAGTNVTVQTNNDAFAGNGDITVGSAITTTGTGSLTLSAFRNIVVNAAINLLGGNLTLRADNTGIGSGAVTTSAAITTNGGNVTIGGGNGTITAATYNANGSIATAATGYATGNSALSQGVTIGGAITAGGGNIIINGRGSNSTTSSIGVEQLTGNAITTTGAGSINISGIARGTAANGNPNFGVAIRNLVTAVNGAIQLNGVGGNGTSNNAIGVLVSSSGGIVRTTGTGAILMSGVGGTGAGGSNYGVLVNNPSGISPTGTGSILLYGVGGTAGTLNTGVAINQSGSNGSIAGNGGAITINGTGGASTGATNAGVALIGSAGGGGVLTNSGTITINGTGGGSGASSANHGIFISGTNATIATTGASTITLTGTGGVGTGGNNHGVNSTIASGIITNGTGNISITGTAGAGAGSTAAVASVSNAIRTAGTSGNITILGDSYSFTGANALNSVGTISIAPLSAITLGLGTGAGVASLSNAALGNISAATGYNFGSATTSDITVNTTAPFTSRTLAFTTAGNLTLTNAFNGLTSLTTTAPTGLTTINGVLGGTTAIGALTMTGQDLAINANVTSSGNISGAFSRDITQAAATTLTNGAASTLTLTAANNSTAGTGNLTLSGNLNVGTGALTLLSGINGTRPSWTISGTSLLRQGATFGAISVSGFLDVAVNRDLNSSSNVTIATFRDLTLNALNTITTGAANALTLTAANNSTGGTGNLTLNGNLSSGTGGLTLLSGINGTRPSWTANSTTLVQQGASFSTVSITGFLDTVINRDITSSGSITITAFRDLTLNAARTITTGAAGSLALNAANGSTVGTGNLTLSGNLSSGTGSLTLISGINGTRPDWTADATTLVRQGTRFGTISIQGFQDLTINRDLNSNGNLSLLSYRDLTLGAPYTLTPGAGSNLNARAAGGVTTATGNFYLNGTVQPGSGTVTLYSGINGTRPNYTVTATNFVPQGATVGAVDIQGFNDTTIARDITSSGSVTTVAFRDLNVNAGTTITTGAAGGLNLRAANGVVAGTGNLNLNGNLAVGTGAFTLISGINGTRPSWTANATNLQQLGASFGAISWQGFASLVLDLPIVSTSTVTFSGNTETVLSQNITTTSSITFSNAARIAEGANITLASGAAGTTFSATLNGTAGGAAENLAISSGTGTVTFSGVVGGVTPLGDLTVTANNITVSQNLNGTGTLTLGPATAGRAVNVGTAQADNNTGNGFNLSNNETTRIQNGWGAVVLGNLTSGDTTNSRAAWTLPVSFVSGNDFINNAAISDTGSVFVQAVRDVVLNQSITTSNAGANAIVLVAGRNLVNNSGAGALTVGAGGRWLAYSSNPTDSVGEDLLSNNFNRYSCTYGGPCPALGTGNGLLYSYTPTLTVSVSGQTYNYGDVVITPTGYTILTTGYLNAIDSSEDVLSGTGVFATTYVQGNNAGTSYTIVDNGSTFASALGYGFTYASPVGTVGTRAITLRAADQSHVYGFGGLGSVGFGISSGSLYGTDAISGVTLTTDASLSAGGQYNYRASPWLITPSAAVFSSGLGSNYAITYANAPTGLTISQRALTISASALNKVYDGNANASATLSDNRVSGDALTTGFASATFPDKNVGTGRTVTVSGITLGGADAGNYSFNTSATTTANITQRALTISASALNKVYDGNANASATLSDNRVAGDVLTTGFTSATFPDKNVGTGRTVTVSGITLGGADAGNYTFNTSATTTADITQRALTISASALNKVYDGNANASATLSDNRVSGDALTTGFTSATFPDKNVGNARTVTVSGITLGGTDAGNYTFNTSATTTADITQRALTISASALNKVYDGNANASATLSDNRVAGDVLTTGFASATFPDKNVGNARTVTVSGITLGGTDAGNYTFNTSATTTANITQRALTISASALNKVYDGNANASATLSDNRVAGDVLTTGFASATFPDKNVGNARTVTVSGITLGGADAGNYTFNTSATTTANITQRALTISATALNKVYDGNANASATLSDNRVAGDVLTTGFTSANFANANGGTGKLVTVSGITLGGADAGNYSFNTSATTTADITQRNLIVTVNDQTVVYGTAVPVSSLVYNGFIIGEDATFLTTAPTISSVRSGIQNAGTYVANYTASGGVSGNYSFTYNAGDLTVTPAPVTVTAGAVSQIYGVPNSFNGFTAVGLQNGETIGSVTLASNAPLSSSGLWSAGNWLITPGAAAGGTFNPANYSIAYQQNALTITQRALTISASALNKVYDGNANASATLSDNRVAGDVLTTGFTSATFPDKNVGNARTVTVSGITLGGADAGNYTFNTSATTTANITQRALTISASALNKVYDGNANASATLSDNRVAGDVLTTGFGAANFANKNAGNAKTVTVSGITLGGADAGNYSFNTSATTSANITQRALTISATALNKVYDGSSVAAVNYSDNRVSGDVLAVSGVASFADKNVGVGKSVNITGITLGGADAGNYTFNTSASSSATISQRALTISATALNKVYDGTNTASVTLSDNRVVGDALTTGFASATFPDDAVGNGRTVTVLGITLGGADAGNYTFNTSATTTANITLTATPPPPPPPVAMDSGLPNTVVKVSQDPSSTVPTPPDDGVFATPVTAYVLVYLPNNAPLTNRINNQPPPVRVPQARFGLAAYDAPDEEKRWGKNRWKGRRLLAGPDKTFIYDANTPAFGRRGGFGASPDIKSI